MQYINIPEERVGVLIGEGGKTKHYIEKRTKTKIEIDNEAVTIDGEPEKESEKAAPSRGPVMEWIAKDIVLAIGRGFNPTIALKLLNESYMLEVITISDFTNTKKAAIRMKGRVIGEEGRTRKVIEQITGCYVSVYGKTIALIGTYDEVPIAKEAVGMILTGAPHATVYRFLERKKQEQLEEKRVRMKW